MYDNYLSRVRRVPTTQRVFTATVPAGAGPGRWGPLSARQLLLALVGWLWVYAAEARAQDALQQEIKVSFAGVPLAAALQQLGDQAHIRFVYNESVLRQGQPLSGTFQAPLGEVLRQVLGPLAVRYELVDNKFVVLRAAAEASPPPAPPAAARARPQEGFVQQGVVTDEQGNPLPGVTVHLEGRTNVAVTNAQGSFSIGTPDEGQALTFRFIGYKNASALTKNGVVLAVQLQPDPAELDEVTVIGYGTTTKRTATGATTRVTATEIQNQPVTNVLQALQGRMPGVSITQANGLPGSAISVQIRGANSLLRGSEPLYIVDGVPYLSTAINQQSTTTNVIDGANGSTNPLNSINPNDIESLDVLKDADATAIYGSRGANGVVLITTKKGKAGKTTFQIDAKSGASQVARMLPLLSTAEFLNIRRTGFRNSGVTPTANNAPDLVTWDPNAYTDYQKLLIGKTAWVTDVAGNVSGGDVRTTFRVSGTYHRENNVFVGDQGYTRGAGSLSLTHRSANSRFELGVTASYNADRNNVSIQDLTGVAYALAPNFPLYNPDGSLYWTGSFLGPANPLGLLRRTVDNKSTNLIVNNTLRFNILPGLDFRTSAGLSRTDMEQKRLTPRAALDPRLNTTSSALFSYNVSDNFIVEPQLTLDKHLGPGTLGVLLGGTWQYRNSRQPYYLLASDYLSDDFLENVAAAQTRSVNTSSSQYKYASVFGRVNYNWADKYIVNVNVRRDGSSRFGPNNRYGNFASVGAAWVFSAEKGLGLPAWLSFGKLRGSYGRVGSDNIGDYAYLDSYTSYTYNYNGSPGLVPSRIANPDYRWEQTDKMEGALELNFLDDRIALTAAYYRNRSGNQLISYVLSAQTGFTSYQANLPATVQNQGWEGTLATENIRSKDFSWRSSFNITANRNELLQFDGIERTSYYSQYQVGRPISGYYLYQYNGFSPTTGLPTFQDFNNNGTISSGYAATGRGDRAYYGPRYPRFYGGLGNTLRYKGLSLDFLFQFVKQQGLAPLAGTFSPPGYDPYNASRTILDYIAQSTPSQPVVNSAFSPAYTAYSNYTTSDAMLVDASFIRLKNVSLSYQLPTPWLKAVRLQSARVYVLGQNLLTLTPYQGYDPESQGLVLPPLRTITGGIQLSL